MPTTNPVPSTDPSDLLFNAGKLDEVVNGTASSFTDRLGVARRTVAGINAAADNVLNSIGYAVPVAYASGISLTLASQTVEYNGVVYAPKSSALPFITSSWGTDSSKFRAIQVTDADLITYAPGGTGAVATTVQAKLLEFVSVLDFYANGVSGVRVDPTGVVDSTLGIRAALTAGAGKRVYVPSGNYKVTSNVTVPSNTMVYGDGASSRIFGSGTNSLLRAEYPASNIIICDLHLDGMKTSGTADVVVGFYIPASLATASTKNENIVIERCQIKNASAGVGIENGKYCVVRNCIISHMYRHTAGAYSGVYGYGVVFNGCTRSSVEGNTIGVSGGLIQRHAVYLPVFRDAEISPTVLVFCSEIRVENNTLHVDYNPASEPFSSCIEAWNYFDFLISGNLLLGGVRGINAAPEYQNGSRVQIVGNTFKDNEICIRNGPESFGASTYFEEYLIANNQLMPRTSAAHQCVKLQGVKKIIFTGNYCRGDGSTTFAFGYHDTVQNIVADVISSANNTITGFTQGFYLSNITRFVDSETVFANFTSTPIPYQKNAAITSSQMRPVFAPYTELHAYNGTDWGGVSYYSNQIGGVITYDGSAWVNQQGIRVRGNVSERPNKASNGNDADPLTLNLPYGFKYYDTVVGGLIYWNGACWYATQQPAPPDRGTTSTLNAFKTSYPNAMTAYNITSWNTTTSKPVFYNALTNNWVYADGTAI